MMEPEVSRWKADLYDFLSKPATSLVDTARKANSTRQVDRSPSIRRRSLDQGASVHNQANRCWSGTDNCSSQEARTHRKGQAEKAEVSDPEANRQPT